MEPALLLRIGALVMMVCGIKLLQTAWRRPGSGVQLVGGWMVLILALGAWAMTSSIERGIALGLIGAMVIALSVIAITALRAPIRASKTERMRFLNTTPSLGPLGVSQKILVGVLMGPLAGLAAVAVCVAAFVALQHIGVEHTVNLTIVSFSFPVLWGGLTVLVGADTKLWRKATLVFAVGILPIAYISFAA